MNKIEEPKACPFCGGEAHMIHLRVWHVFCPACVIGGKGNRKGGRAFAIKFWNTRRGEKEK